MSCIKGSNPFVSAIQQKRPLRGVFYFRLSLIQDLEGHSPPSAYRKKGISLLRDLALALSERKVRISFIWRWIRLYRLF